MARAATKTKAAPPKKGKAAPAKKTRKSSKKGNVVSLDFSDVKSFKAVPEGPYLFEVTSVEQGTSQNDNPTLKFELAVAEGKFEGSKVWHTTTLTKEAMWKTREVLDALGQEVDGEVDIDLDELVGARCGGNVYHDEYEKGKVSAKIADFFSAEDFDSEEEEEDETPKKGKASKSKKDEKPAKGKKSKKDEPNVNEMDEDELAELVDELGLDVDLDDYSSIKKKRAAVADAMDDTDEEDDNDDTYTSDQIEELDIDQLAELNDDLELGLDFDDYEDMKPKVAIKEAAKAILKILKKKKLLAD